MKISFTFAESVNITVDISPVLIIWFINWIL